MSELSGRVVRCWWVGTAPAAGWEGRQDGWALEWGLMRTDLGQKFPTRLRSFGVLSGYRLRESDLLFRFRESTKMVKKVNDLSRFLAPVFIKLWFTAQMACL